MLQECDTTLERETHLFTKQKLQRSRHARRCTFIIRAHIEVPGSVSHRAVAEYQAPTTSPRMRVRHFNIAVVQAWSNFKPGMNVNGSAAIVNFIVPIDVVNVGAGVDEALVELRRGVEGIESGRGGGGVRGGQGRDV